LLWIAIPASILAVVLLALHLSDLPGREEAEKLACTDLGRLQVAELRTEARQALHDLSDAKAATSCDSKAQVKLEIEALERVSGNNDKTADELRGMAQETTVDQLNVRDRRAAVAFQRARIYRRAARLERTAGVVGGQRTAIRRAIRAYLSGLRRDPYESSARRGLLSVLQRRGGPGGRASANARCQLARRLRRASLLPEAAFVYAQALRTGHTTKCLEAELRRSRRQYGQAIERVRDAEAQPDTRKGHDEARRLLLEALALDPSVARARALAKHPRPRPQESGFLPQVGDGLTQIGGWLVKAAKAAADHLAGLAFAIIVLLLFLVVLSHALLRLSQRSRRARDLMDHTSTLHRFTRRRVVMDPGEDTSLVAVIVTLADTFESTPVSPDAPTSFKLPDEVVFLTSSTADALGGISKLLDALSAPAGLAAFIDWFRTAVARYEIRIACLLLPATSEGVGLRVGVRDRRNRPTAVFTRRQNLNPGGSAGSDDAYHELAVDGGEWLRTLT
jgi:hypothetical protein